MSRQENVPRVSDWHVKTKHPHYIHYYFLIRDIKEAIKNYARGAFLDLGSMAKRSSVKTLFLIKKQKQLHPPLRCYYMFRNLLYVKTKYRHVDSYALKKVERGVKEIIKRNLLYGRNSTTLIQYLFVAYRHFKNNRMGKYMRH